MGLICKIGTNRMGDYLNEKLRFEIKGQLSEEGRGSGDTFYGFSW